MIVFIENPCVAQTAIITGVHFKSAFSSVALWLLFIHLERSWHANYSHFLRLHSEVPKESKHFSSSVQTESRAPVVFGWSLALSSSGKMLIITLICGVTALRYRIGPGGWSAKQVKVAQSEKRWSSSGEMNQHEHWTAAVWTDVSWRPAPFDQIIHP